MTKIRIKCEYILLNDGGRALLLRGFGKKVEVSLVIALKDRLEFVDGRFELTTHRSSPRCCFQFALVISSGDLIASSWKDLSCSYPFCRACSFAPKAHSAVAW